MHHYEVQNRNPVQPKACDAVWFKHSISLTCPLCSQLDSALHILSGSQHTQVRNMITERHNLACSMILKAIISKTGSLGSCLVCMDIGSSKRLAIQNQIPDTAETRIIPKPLFPPRFSDKNRFTSRRPDAALVAPISAKIKSNRLAMKGAGVFGGGN